MTNISIYRLLKTSDEAILEAQSSRMKPMRLKSLQHDPSTFISTYEGEVNQPKEFWLDRLRPAFVQHWYGVMDVEDSPVTEEAQIYDRDWIAFMVLLDEDAIRKQTTKDEDSATTQNSSAAFEMAALWVDPTVRGKKVAGRMIASAVQWIEAQARIQGKYMAYINTTARKENTKAISLYLSLGFQVLNEDGNYEKDGKVAKVVEMRLDIPISE